MGREMNCLLETIAGVESVQPYSDVSFRVISKIADVLTTDNTCQAFNIGRIRSSARLSLGSEEPSSLRTSRRSLNCDV